MGGTDLTRETALTDGRLQEQLLLLSAGNEARERTVLASAIHDDPMQLIVAAMLQIDYLRMTPVDDDDAWEKVIGMLETSVERLRRLIAAITPADLSDGLCDAWRVLAVGIFMGSATTVTVRPAAGVRLSPLQEQVAYEILRAGLLNIREHANARTVELTVEQSDRFVATITDDGVERVDGAALAGLRSFAARAGGDLRIDNQPGSGSTLRLSLPPG